MSNEVFYDNQNPNYRNDQFTKTVKIDSTTNSISITDTTIPKTITINVNEVTNGVDSILWDDVYATIQKTLAISYAYSTPTTLNVNSEIDIVDGLGDENQLVVTGMNLTDTSGNNAIYNLTVSQIIDSTGRYTQNDSSSYGVVDPSGASSALSSTACQVADALGNNSVMNANFLQINDTLGNSANVSATHIQMTDPSSINIDISPVAIAASNQLQISSLAPGFTGVQVITPLLTNQTQNIGLATTDQLTINNSFQSDGSRIATTGTGIMKWSGTGNCTVSNTVVSLTDTLLNVGALTASNLTLKNSSGSIIMDVNTNYIKYPPVTFPILPVASVANQGTRAIVRDSTTNVFNAIYTGGGGICVPVFCDGANYRVG